MSLRFGLWAGVAAAIIATLGLGLAGARWPGYNPLTQTVSELVARSAPHRLPLSAVFVLYNGLLIGFGRALGQTAVVLTPFAPDWGERSGRRVIALGLLGWLLLLLPVDPPGMGRTVTGLTHSAVAAGMTVMAFAAVFMGGRWLRGVAGLETYDRFSRLVAGLIVVCAAWTLVALQRDGWAGLAERSLIGAYELWMTAVALRLARAVEEATSDERQSLTNDQQLTH